MSGISKVENEKLEKIKTMYENLSKIKGLAQEQLQFFYLFISTVRVLYLSISLNSSLLILWAKTFRNKVILKCFKSNLSEWTDLECIERAELSHFASVKHPRWVLVRSCVFWIVLPK